MGMEQDGMDFHLHRLHGAGIQEVHQASLNPNPTKVQGGHGQEAMLKGEIKTLIL